MKDLLNRVWPEASHVVGVAAEDIYKWPVVVRPWDPKKYCYRWPYYYTHSKASHEKSELLADVLAVQADEIIEDYDKDVALLSMEGLDSRFANKIQGLMKHRDTNQKFSLPSDYNASQMTSILQKLRVADNVKIPCRCAFSCKSSSANSNRTRPKNQRSLRRSGHKEFFVDHEDPHRYWVLSDNVETCIRPIRLNEETSFEKAMSNTENAKNAILNCSKPFLKPIIRSGLN